MITRLATAVALLAAVASGQAAAQSYVPADCAVTYRSDNAWQGQLQHRIGADPQNLDYSWAEAAAFTLPATPINSAKVVFPTGGTGFGDAGTATVYLTVVQSYDAPNTCAGYGPFMTFVKPPTQICTTVRKVKTCRPSTDTVLAATVVTPLQTGDIEFVLNADSLAVLKRLQAEQGNVVFGISMLIPRVTIYPWGEDPKKQNQAGEIIDINRSGWIGACSPTVTAYCPSLVLQ
jgi:hypothetical protein